MNDISWLSKIAIAHRGLHNKMIPENSIMAFKNAIEYQYAIELDVHVTVDNQIVVFHDDNLKRICGIDKPIETLTSDDYQLYKLNSTQEGIPLLQDVLALVDGKVPLLIEVKTQSKHRKSNLVILNALLGYEGHVAIQSFNPFILQWFKKNAPTIPRGQLSSDFKHEKLNPLIKFILSQLFFNFLTKPKFISYDVRALPTKVVEKARKKGKLILGYTVVNKEMANTISKFCDNIIFENFSPIIT